MCGRQFILTWLLCMINFSLQKEKPMVITKLGKIIGNLITFENKEVFTFQSIPFAKPPIENLRFRKPLPVKPWHEPIIADDLPPACVQYSEYPFPFIDKLPGKSEDCLYLNIWMPAEASPSNQKSVMFFVHSGGFRVSSSRLDYFNGEALAALGDVVVVTTNYRLGPFGFLYSGTEDAPGNMGLYDILEALKWVNSNIERFGGNKKSITIFGHSSGAKAINMFLTSPLFKKLFIRAIFESGSIVSVLPGDNEHDTKVSEELAEAVGCSNENVNLQNEPIRVVQCLRGIDALNLTLTLQRIIPDVTQRLKPRYGDEIFPDDPRLSFLEHKFRNVDILIGNVNNEGALPITKSHQDIFGLLGKKDSQINKTFGESLMREDFKKFPNPDAVIKHYLGDLDEDDYEAVRYQVQAAKGDFARICPSVYLAELVAEKGNRVYYYFFQHRSSNSRYARWMGVPHFDEVPYVFGYPLRHPQNYTTRELQLSRSMLDIWTSFAKFGTSSLQRWPLYSNDNHHIIAFKQNKTVTVPGPHLNNCNFFRKYFEL